MEYLGLGKVQWGSSVTHLSLENGTPDAEVFLTERASQVKADGAWPSQGIEHFLNSHRTKSDLKSMIISENRDAQDPLVFEEGLNQKYPFYEYLKRSGLENFSRKFNSNIEYLSHHYCHAMAALAISPFERSIIVVMDGAGTEAGDFKKRHFEKSFLPGAKLKKNRFEECSVYLQDGPSLSCLYKRWQTLQTGDMKKSYGGWTLSEGLGIFYEESAKYIFNNIREAGKVMGLSPYGKPKPVMDRLGFLRDLDWGDSFKGKGKKEWENSGRFQDYADYAATVQAHFEEDLFGLLKEMKKLYPDVRNLIFTGGCALNCIANMKILYNGLFDEVYVPPFPSDECISFGAAYGSYLSVNQDKWQPLDWSRQVGNFGPRNSIPDRQQILKAFSSFGIIEPDNICNFTADLLSKGRIIAWFQGRSESGPRALGNRSILARIDVPGLKDLMNAKVKGREAFRPYGSSWTLESAPEYFDIPKGFESPFMSFAPKVKSKYGELLKEVTHVNGTSRIQTVSRTQNPRFWALLNTYGQKTGLPGLLNTSLNVMGQPIVETVKDAKEFLERTSVDGIVVGDIYVAKIGPT